MRACIIPHVHWPRRRNHRIYQTCRCGRWRWKAGARWHPDIEDTRPEE